MAQTFQSAPDLGAFHAPSWVHDLLKSIFMQNIISYLDNNINVFGSVASILALIITIIGFWITISKIRKLHKEYIFKIRGKDYLSRLTSIYKEISKCLNNQKLFRDVIDDNMIKCDSLLDIIQDKSPRKIKVRIIKLRKVIIKYKKPNNILFNPSTIFNSYDDILEKNLQKMTGELNGLIEYLTQYQKDQQWSLENER